jgi:hypothetical protein
MIIIDNFLPKDYYTYLYALIMSGDFDWYYSYATLTQPLFGKHTQESVQFNHSFFVGDEQKKFYDVIEPMYYALEEHGLKPKTVYRTKANMLMQEKDYPDNTFHGPHPDHPIPNTFTMIYYLNDSDGDTYLFKENYLEHLDFEDNIDDLTVETRVTPKANSAFIFDATQLHASSPPRKTDRRVVVNIVFGI